MNFLKTRVSYKDGSRYHGWIRQPGNVRQGMGRIVHPNKNSYIGQWHNNKAEGWGLWSDETEYFIGHWMYGERQGPGAFLMKDGHVALGVFDRGAQTSGIVLGNRGISRFIDKDLEFEHAMKVAGGKTDDGKWWVYRGEVDNDGNPDGVGGYLSEMGTSYHGEWKSGKRYGWGFARLNTSKDLILGMWKDDKLDDFAVVRRGTSQVTVVGHFDPHGRALRGLVITSDNRMVSVEPSPYDSQSPLYDC
jgi:hypothetical protein